MKRKFLNIKEVSEYLGVESSTLYAWVHTKEIPYYKIGRLVKFKIEEIEDWINIRKVEVLKYD